MSDLGGNEMSSVRRVYVEKKDAYAVKARELESEIKSYLGISGVTKVRELIRYDVRIFPRRPIRRRW